MALLSHLFLHRKLLRLLAGFLAMLLFGSMHAQERKLRFQHLTIEDGLAQNMVDCILQDRQGFMWFGTWNGLCKYDGYRFENFNSETDGINNFIQALYEDAFGNIWTGTREGIYLYRYDRQTFQKIVLDSLSSAPAAVQTIIAGTDSTTFIGTSTTIWQIKMLNSEGAFEVLESYAIGSDIEGNSINALLLDREDHLWIGTDAGLSVLIADKGILRRYKHEANDISSLTSNLVTCLWQEPNGNIWIGTEYGLNRYDPGSKQFSRYYREESSNNPLNLPHNYISDLHEDRENNLIIGTLGGIAILDGTRKKMMTYVEVNSSHHGLNNNFVNCLFVDRNENVWIGTDRGGLNFYNKNQIIFEHYEMGSNDSPGLSHSTVNSIYEDEKYIWIGTAGGGLNRYDKATGRFHHYLADPQNARSISSNFVTCIYRDRKAQLWIGTWGGGLNKFMGEDTGNPYFQRYGGGHIPGEKSTFIASVTEDTKGDLWLGTLEGLIHYDTEEELFSLRFHRTPDKITEVGTVLMDGHTLWAGTRLGLFRIDRPDTDRPVLRKYTKDQNDPGSISGNYVISIALDPGGKLWFGTYGNGINYFDRKSESFVSYSTKDGFSNNIIYGIEPDDDGRLWLSTDYGLIRFDPASKQTRNFFTADGLLNNQYYWSASYKNSAGKLYFGGMSGMDAFFPDWVKESPYHPKVVLTSISLINGPVLPGRPYNGVQVLDRHIAKSQEVQLSYKEKMLSLEFSPLVYRDADLLEYAYILEGFEEEWNYVSSERPFATYTNLRPGEYTFKVKVSDTNGKFMTAPKEVALIIAPPFWDTLWFKFLAFFILVGGIFGFQRYRVYNLKKQKVILEREVRDRTEKINQQKEALAKQAVQLKNNNLELQRKQKLIEGQNKQLEGQNWEILAQRDELMDLNTRLKLESQSRLTFFTNVSHEFRTPLTLITGPLELLLKDKRLPEEVNRTLRIIDKNARRLLQLINQMLNVRKIEKIRMGARVAPGDIREFCGEIFDAFKNLAEIKNITFLIKTENIPDEVWFDAEKLGHILYNLLSNAFKYTPEGGCISLEATMLPAGQPENGALYRMAAADQQLSIKIIDTGIGISEKNIPLLFDRFFRIESQYALPISGSGIGLALTKELILAHHGDIFVKSREGQGSTFEIRFPINTDAYLPEEIVEKPRVVTSLQKQVDILRDELIRSQGTEKGNEASEHVYQSERPTILIVEDNQDLRSFIASQLNTNFNVLEASDGKAGIDLAKNSNPDLIISDLMMPNVDGYELCANIKNHLDTSHIPVILLTAKSTLDARIEGYQIGADDYLPKPFHFNFLVARINNLIESRRKLRLAYLGAKAPDTEAVTTNQKDREFLDAAIRIIHENIDRAELTIQDFAQAMRVSRSLLHKKLISLTNQSASEFINHIRMQRAAELLKQNQLNISEVAYAVGYSDPKYFSRVFSKHFGHAPSTFVQKHCKPIGR